eukprot:sb/3470983/
MSGWVYFVSSDKMIRTCLLLTILLGVCLSIRCYTGATNKDDGALKEKDSVKVDPSPEKTYVQNHVFRVKIGGLQPEFAFHQIVSQPLLFVRDSDKMIRTCLLLTILLGVCLSIKCYTGATNKDGDGALVKTDCTNIFSSCAESTVSGITTHSCGGCSGLVSGCKECSSEYCNGGTSALPALVVIISSIMLCLF